MLNVYVSNALVDMVCKCGNMKSAEFQSPWHCEIARRAADVLLELEPWNAGRYVMISNIYATANKWHDSEEVRIQLEERVWQRMLVIVPLR
ncbi:hypothetical protein MLD38_031484 [Melastoma candidum]|uniref:Uncharacterized protein n=1 Tax=Melastoma candidum TaxID=119954 RepID=A0ACB9MPU5_9MYRT|nr:hypothetical protein MLD38_031484 [Melastoma candidum]